MENEDISSQVELITIWNEANYRKSCLFIATNNKATNSCELFEMSKDDLQENEITFAFHVFFLIFY